MKRGLSIIAYLIIWYIAIIYIPWLWTKIDEKTWIGINQKIFNTVDYWEEKLWKVKYYLDEFIENIWFSFNSKWSPEDYIKE